VTGRGEPEDVARTRRLRVMGGVLRNAGSDESGDSWGEPEPIADSAADAALRREVPPHHGG